MKKSSFIEGTFVAYISVLITKIIGALYGIPFYSIIGTTGGVIYSCAYSVYALFLVISTSGIPTAVSIVISEYNTLGYMKAKQRAYKIGLRVVCAISFTAFLFMQIFAEKIGVFFLSDNDASVSVSDIAAAVRTVAVCLLIVPLLSIKRGYMQGHKYISESSFSQIIEQVVRIAVALLGAYLIINVFQLGTTLGICIALSGTALGAAFAWIYMERKYVKNKKLFVTESTVNEPYISSKEIFKKLFSHCVTIVIVAISMNLYEIVDMKLILVGLDQIGYSADDALTISSLIASWIPKICMIISSLSIGMTNSVVPHIASNFADKNMEAVKNKFNQAVSIVFTVAIPLTLGLMMLGTPVFTMFYGDSEFGGTILSFAVLVSMSNCITMTISMAMQSMDCGRAVCVCTIIGLLINGIFDLPMIYLFDNLGLAPYLGATAASLISQIVTFVLLMIHLWRKHRISFVPAFITLAKQVVPLAGMCGSVWLMLKFINIPPHRNFMLVLDLVIIALVGGIVYFALALVFGVLDDLRNVKGIGKIINKIKPAK